MHSQPALNAVVETWVDDLIEAGGQTATIPDGPDSLSNKRRRPVSTDVRNDDLETTPHPPLFCTLSTPCILIPPMPYRTSTDYLLHTGRDQNLNETRSTSTADTNGTSRSRKSSPRRVEAALRRTLHWPIARVPITELKSAPTSWKA